MILQFKGVVGEFFQPCFWKQDGYSLYMRAKAPACLEALSAKYQLALVFDCDTDRALCALQYLSHHGANIDGAYVSTHGPWSKLPLCYDQIYEDFGVLGPAVPDRVLVLHTHEIEPLP